METKRNPCFSINYMWQTKVHIHSVVGVTPIKRIKTQIQLFRN